MPIDFIAGRQNQIFVPETSQRTYDWVRTHNPEGRYSRHVFQDYAHMDLWIGRTANKDIFPFIEAKLEAALSATEPASPTRR